MRAEQSDTALVYRAKALEALEVAMTKEDPLLREWWASIAKTYYDIAEHLERLRQFGI